MKIEIVSGVLIAESDDGNPSDYDNIRAVIGLLHSNKSLEGIGILKLKGFPLSHAVKMTVDLCNDMKRHFKIVAVFIDQVGFEVQQSWDRNHPPGCVLP